MTWMGSGRCCCLGPGSRRTTRAAFPLPRCAGGLPGRGQLASQLDSQCPQHSGHGEQASDGSCVKRAARPASTEALGTVRPCAKVRQDACALGPQPHSLPEAALHDVFMPYTPEPGSSYPPKCRTREYYESTAGLCCSKCPPGQHLKALCTKTSDTLCAPCEDSTYTQIWNWVLTCFSCGAPCSLDQVETQACTPQRNRVCSCKPGRFCMLGMQDGCRQCRPLRKCSPGYGVVRLGTATSDVLCAACAPGTFSDTLSSTDACRPHRNCSTVAIPGNATVDAVCASVPPTLGAAPGPARTPRSVSPRAQPGKPTPGLSTVPSTAPLLPVGFELPTGKSKNGLSLPIGLIVGLTALGLLIIGLVNCVIVTQRKKKPSCLQREAKVPHVPVDKIRGVTGTEQQLLLTAAPSSSFSSLESSASATGTSTDKTKASGETGASPGTSESQPGGHGTQVNVTCIVNVCSSSEHSPRCPSQASATTEDVDTSPSGCPKDEQVPFSQEERPFQSLRETPETLLQSLEKSLPLGVLDQGMKLG
ncbi:tumor necrosis factor receptor superfamily member 1B isoform X2 [Octodon degus]|uniref:Tumor necrosis factor receptor superfamily member 1B isoform X2 n=1 Tax=Octodon degus TaxID=10160 RepID=A0A6P6D541_OCTDE|nr:tumor necrosis factor receptor superfamily member 1B isoform X2 [Octodon degus]